MARVFAFTQFLIVSLGVLTLHLLVKLHSNITDIEGMAVFAQFLARYALWLFAVPILYAAIGSAVEGKVSAKAVKAVGAAICVILLALLGFPICYYLF